MEGKNVQSIKKWNKKSKIIKQVLICNSFKALILQESLVGM